jgi:hypothetical protein
MRLDQEERLLCPQNNPHRELPHDKVRQITLNRAIWLVP